jgi:hypothetical protein
MFRLVGLGWVAGMVVVLTTLRLPAQSQKAFEPLSIDRPDVSNLPVTVLPGHYQIELGTEITHSSTTHEYYLPNFLLRTGLGKKTELRVGINYLLMDSLLQRLDDNLLITSLSVKYRIAEEAGLRPSIAVQPEITFPFGDGRHQDSQEIDLRLTNYAFLILFNNTVHKQVFINYNAGIFWAKNKRPDYLLSVSTSFMHTHRLGYFLEVYKIFDEVSDIPVSYDAGITFLIAPRFQVDIYAGRRWLDGSAYNFLGAGVGFRIDREDLKPKSFREIAPVH